MAVKAEGARGITTLRYMQHGFSASQGHRLHGYVTQRNRTLEESIESLRVGIDRDARSLNKKMVALVRLLAARGDWCEIVRLVVGVGGYRPAELAEVLSVMRSTVTRWYNCETKPQEAQVPIYTKRLLAHMEARRPNDRIVDPKDLVQA